MTQGHLSLLLMDVPHSQCPDSECVAAPDSQCLLSPPQQFPLKIPVCQQQALETVPNLIIISY